MFKACEKYTKIRKYWDKNEEQLFQLFNDVNEIYKGF